MINRQLQKGYTLIEVLVSAIFLAMALIPIMMFSTSSVNIASSIQDNVIAVNLAQEGIEVVRAIRDTNWMTGSAFGANIPTGQWELQWDTVALTDTYDGDRLRYSDIGLYSYDPSASNLSKFKRRITISYPSAVEMRIVSEVLWDDRARPKVMSAEDRLFNWK